MISIVIPMAGEGQRFKVKGYDEPKPFIKFNGKMMIEHVLEGLMIPDAKYLLVIREEFKQKHSEKLTLLKNRFPVDFITVEGLTQGASCTALAAHKYINNEQPVVFADSDNIFDNDAFRNFISCSKSSEVDGCIMTFRSSEKCFSYALCDEDNYVIKTKEKEVISDLAIAGIYMFSKGSCFVESAIDMMIYGDKDKGEYYMSNVYNWAIKKGLKIGVSIIDSNQWNCVGTPEQLEEYLNRSY